jgi:hypothetical protein
MRHLARMLVILGFALVPATSLADVIELKTGQRIEGMLEQATSAVVIIKVDGRRTTFRTEQVQAIYFGAAPVPSVKTTEDRVFDAPKGYRGIPWGTPMAIVRQRLEVAYGRWDTELRPLTKKKEGDYRCEMSTPDHVSCHEDFPFWDAKMLWGPEVSGVGRTLEGIRLQVNIVGGAKDYPQANGAFLARYGQPHKIETVTFRTRYGGEVRGEVLVWESDQVFVRLQEHCDFINSSCGEIFTKRYLKQWEELEIERARQRGKALP